MFCFPVEPIQLANFYLELRTLAQDDPEDYAGWEGLEEASDEEGGDGGGGTDTGSGSESNGNGNGNGNSNSVKKRGKKRRIGEAGLSLAGGAAAGGRGGRGTKKR